MIQPETVRYDGQLAASLCCDALGGTSTVPIATGESFCPGQPVSLNGLGEAISGTSNFVGIAESQNPAVDVVYVNIGGEACAGIPVFGDGDLVYAGKELPPAGNFSPMDQGGFTGNIERGGYEYAVTFIQDNCNGTFESTESLPVPIIIPTVDGHSVQLNSIPIGIYSDTTKRNIYRREVNEVPVSEINYALTGAATASSSSFAEPPENVNDDLLTYWGNDFAFPVSSNDAWIYIDLGVPREIKRWEAAWFSPSLESESFKIESSNDAIIWTQEGPTATSPGPVTFVTPVTARYFRLFMDAGSQVPLAPPPAGFVFWVREFRLIGDSVSPLVSTYKLVDTINDNTTTTYLDIKDTLSLANQQPPVVSTIQDSLTNVSQFNFEVGTYDLGTGCITIPTGEEGCIAASCNKSTRDMTEDEFAVEINPCSWNMWPVSIENPAIPRQLRHFDARGTSRKINRFIKFEGQITHGGYSGKLKGINALNGVWRTAASPTIKNDGFFLLEWIGADGLKYSTQAQVFGSKPIVEIDPSCSKFKTPYTVELVTQGEVFVGDEVFQVVEEGHVSGLDVGNGGVSYSQAGLSDLENPTIVDLTSFCNRDSEIPMSVRITWTGLQDQAELPPNTGENALGTYLGSYIILANADTGAAIKLNVNFKRTDVIEIDKNGLVYYNGVENPSIVDPSISIAPTLISGALNTIVLADSSHWGQNAHGKLIQADIGYFNVI